VAVVEISGLIKRYGDLEAVAGVDLTVEKGEVFGLLGPNGAGKTTIVEILEGHRDRTAGDVRVLGHDPANAERDLKERIGIVLQETSVEEELKVGEALDIYGGMYPKRRDTAELLEIVGLTEKTTSRIGTLSGGQRRRLELALGLVGDPDVLFLDEPTTGFDPSARRQAWTVIDNLRALGKTILLTTHYMDEAQHLSDRVAVIAKGKIVDQGTPDTIGGRESTRSRIMFRTASTEGLPLEVSTEDDRLVAVSDRVTADLHELTSWAMKRGMELEDLTVTRPSLEEIYLALTEGGS
jgi:ABC-2 type transport system ATP-binding protein